jgi:hypothetical protein
MTTLPESRKFENHLQSCGASAGGAQWVKTAVDPFHDIDLDVIGMPDSTSGRSVVYAVTENLTITRPTGITGDTAWDCHVAFTPTIAKADLYPFPAHVDSGDIVPGSCAWGVQMPAITPAENQHLMRKSEFLTANSVAAGQPTFFEAPSGSAAAPTSSYGGLGMSRFLDNDGSSIIRVTGCAFEVHNTTEDVYKSGSVTAYKIARESDKCNFSVTNADAANPARNTATSDTLAATITNAPPTTAAVAKLYNGHTWDAKDGCLVPGVLDAGESDGEKMLPRLHLVKTSHAGANKYWAPTFLDGQKAYMRGVTPKSTTGTTNGAYLESFDNQAPPTVVPEMMTSGAYFTGLSAQTKLTLTLRVFVEVFPSASNALVPLAHPSNPYDAKALQCYQEIMSHMRSGYRVDDNAFGDFFRKAIAVARTIGQTMMPILPPGIKDVVKMADKVAAKADSALAKAQKIESTVKQTVAEARTIKQKVGNRARTSGRALP